MNKILLFLVGIVFLVLPIYSNYSDAAVKIYPAPSGAKLSSDYSVRVDGQLISVYRGIGRIGYGGDYSFAYFDFSGTVSVEITTNKNLSKLAILPKSKNIVATISGRKISFTLSNPSLISIEPGGRNGPLLLFANPPEVNPPQQGASGVIYFGPGIHNAGQINVNNGQTLYIGGGAIVNGWINSSGSNITIRGRGIIDSINWGYDTEKPILHVVSGYSVAIEGIILKDSRTWSLKLQKCNGVNISNIKIIATQTDMRDGISFNNTKNAVVQDSFIRADDDNITTYGLPWNSNMPVENITVTRTVLWSDRALLFRLGLICDAAYVRNLTFTDIDIIHTDVRGQEWIIAVVPCHGISMENFRWEDIRINNESNRQLMRLKPEIGSWHPYSLAPEGNIKRLYFKNVSFTNDGTILIHGPSAEHNIDNVTFENVTKAAVSVLRNSPNVSISGYTSNLNFIAETHGLSK